MLQFCALLTECHQFLIQDRDSEHAHLWSKDDARRLLSIGSDGVAVGTMVEGLAVVILQSAPHPPPIELEGVDHMVECSINLSSGHIVVSEIARLEPGHSIAEKLAPGPYRLRIAYRNLNRREGIDYDTEIYWIDTWPAPLSPPHVIKDMRASKGPSDGHEEMDAHRIFHKLINRVKRGQYG